MRHNTHTIATYRLQNGIESRGIASLDLLFDVQHMDVVRDREVTLRKVAEEGRLA